ncbi:MAG: IS630 family transposase [Dehalococcoidia bacterium]
MPSGEQAVVKAAVQQSPRAAGMPAANWTWKVVRQFVQETFGKRLARRSCFRYRHRLGFAWKRPKKRLLKADANRRAAFVREYAALVADADRTGAKIVFVEEAHVRADADRRGKWVLKGPAALVDSTSPRYGEKASYYSAVCLETGEVEGMELTDASTAETSAAFLRQLWATHAEPLIVIWDNGPAHSGDALRAFLRTPDLRLRLVRLPPYSPDYNADEPIWKWVRQEVTANSCLGSKVAVQQQVGACFAGLADRIDEVRSRCRTALQAQAALLAVMSVSPGTQFSISWCCDLALIEQS